MKTNAYRDGSFKNQPNKMGTTPQHIYTIPTSCAILPTMHNKKFSTHSLNEHGTQHCSLTTFHIRQSIPDSATFTIKFHNITLNPQNTMQTQHWSQCSFCIQDRLYLPCSTATTLLTKYPLFQPNASLQKNPSFDCYSAVSTRAYTVCTKHCCVCSDEDCRIAVETSAFF